MKLCTTCGLEHPDDVSTSHHPDNCPCGSELLHAPDGNNRGPEGCIWIRVVQPGEDRHDSFMKLMQDRELAGILWRKSNPIIQ